MSKSVIAPALSLLLVAALAGCASSTASKPAAKPAEKKPSGITAQLAPTEANGTVKGDIKFVQRDGNVVVSGTIKGLPPKTWHGFHVHENGSCADKGNAAGGHFNPTGKPHGAHGVGEHHVGDMPPLYADSKGVATVDFTSTSLALSGANSIVGKAVIVHEKDDDVTAQPAGNAGARIGCGIVVSN